MRVATVLLAGFVALTCASVAFAQESAKQSYLTLEIVPITSELHAGEIVHVMLRGPAAKKYAESIATEGVSDDMCVFIRCTIDKLVDNGRVQISTVSSVTTASKPERRRMFTFEATVPASDFRATHVRSDNQKAPPRIEVWSLEGNSLRFWKPVDEDDTKK